MKPVDSKIRDSPGFRSFTARVSVPTTLPVASKACHLSVTSIRNVAMLEMLPVTWQILLDGRTRASFETTTVVAGSMTGLLELPPQPARRAAATALATATPRGRRGADRLRTSG